MISYVKAKRRFPESAGNVVNRYEYTGSWGDFELTCPSEGKGKPCIPNRYTFTAREWDPDAQLYYYRARWYDREVKRFTGEDKYKNKYPTTINAYIFTNDNPIVCTDEKGEIAPEVAAGVLLFIVIVTVVFKELGNMKQAIEGSYCPPGTTKSGEDEVMEYSPGHKLPEVVTSDTVYIPISIEIKTEKWEYDCPTPIYMDYETPGADKPYTIPLQPPSLPPPTSAGR